MLMAGENRNTRRKTCSISTFPSTNLTRTGLVLNTGLLGKGVGDSPPEPWHDFRMVEVLVLIRPRFDKLDFDE